MRKLRQRQGLTQEGLGEVAAVEPRYLQEIERGRANPTLAVVVALADALGVDPRQLLRPAEMPPARVGRPPRKAAARTRRTVRS